MAGDGGGTPTDAETKRDIGPFPDGSVKVSKNYEGRTNFGDFYRFVLNDWIVFDAGWYSGAVSFECISPLPPVHVAPPFSSPLLNPAAAMRASFGASPSEVTRLQGAAASEAAGKGKLVHPDGGVASQSEGRESVPEPGMGLGLLTVGMLGMVVKERSKG